MPLFRIVSGAISSELALPFTYGVPVKCYFFQEQRRIAKLESELSAANQKVPTTDFVTGVWSNILWCINCGLIKQLCLVVKSFMIHSTDDGLHSLISSDRLCVVSCTE